MAKAAEKAKKSNKRYDFTPGDFDADKIEPEAAAGKYKAQVFDCELTATKPEKGQNPMIRIDWKLLKAVTDDDDCRKSEKAQVSDWIVFRNDRKGNMGKRKFRQLRELLDLADDILPARLESKSDFKELLTALKKAKADIYVTVADDDQGEPRASVSYVAPKGMLSDDDEDEEEDLDEDEEDEEEEEEEEEDEDEEEEDEEEEEEEDEDEDEDEDKPKKKAKKK